MITFFKTVNEERHFQLIETLMRSKEMSKFTPCEKDVIVLLKVEFSNAHASLNTMSALSKMRDINTLCSKLDKCLLKIKHFKDLFLNYPIGSLKFQ